MKRLALLLLTATSLSGCSLEPRFERPAPAVPQQWPSGTAYRDADRADLPLVRHADIFADEALQRLVAQALANNQDLRVAVANVAAARAQYRAERASILPRISIGGGIAASGGGDRSDETSYGADIGLASFEIDLFGRLRSLSNAAFAEYLASESASRAARLSLVADLTQAWLLLAADRSLLQVARDTERSAARNVELTRLRLEGGIAPRSDLRQAETVWAQARSDIANLTTLVAQDRNLIERLVGAPVAEQDFPTSIEAAEAILRPLPAGADTRVLVHRPDVMEAEYRLRAANARIGAARAAFFPTLSLSAIAGFASDALGQLFSGDSFLWQAEPGASLTIFDGGARGANAARARAERDAAVAAYQRSIQIAFQEVADALARRGTIDAQLAAERDMVEAAEDNYQLAQARYREGVESFLATVDAERTLYSARRQLTATQLLRGTSLVALYRSLGGDVLAEALQDQPAE